MKIPTVSLLLALCLSGCASRPIPDAAKLPGAKVSTGQLSFKTNDEQSLIGEFVMVTGPAFHLDFMKGPGEPLLTVDRQGNQASASGTMAGPGWNGEPAYAPPILKPWLALPYAFQPPETLPPDPNKPVFSVTREKNSKGKTESAKLKFPSQGFEFQFFFD